MTAAMPTLLFFFQKVLVFSFPLVGILWSIQEKRYDILQVMVGVIAAFLLFPQSALLVPSVSLSVLYPLGLSILMIIGARYFSPTAELESLFHAIIAASFSMLVFPNGVIDVLFWYWGVVAFGCVILFDYLPAHVVLGRILGGIMVIMAGILYITGAPLTSFIPVAGEPSFHTYTLFAIGLTLSVVLPRYILIVHTGLQRLLGGIAINTLIIARFLILIFASIATKATYRMVITGLILHTTYIPFLFSFIPVQNMVIATLVNQVPAWQIYVFPLLSFAQGFSATCLVANMMFRKLLKTGL